MKEADPQGRLENSCSENSWENHWEIACDSVQFCF